MRSRRCIRACRAWPTRSPRPPASRRSQVSASAGNLEQLARRLGQVRTDVRSRRARPRWKRASRPDAKKKPATASPPSKRRPARTLDQRLAAVEKAAQFNTNALDHALERLEAQAGIRAGDQAELQKRHAETDGAISRLEESLERWKRAAPIRRWNAGWTASSAPWAPGQPAGNL